MIQLELYRVTNTQRWMMMMVITRVTHTKEDRVRERSRVPSLYSRVECCVERRKKKYTRYFDRVHCAPSISKNLHLNFLYLDLYYVYLEKYFLSNFCIHSRLITKLIELFAQTRKIATIFMRFRVMKFCVTFF